jgi:hypothetical protein
MLQYYVEKLIDFLCDIVSKSKVIKNESEQFIFEREPLRVVNFDHSARELKLPSGRCGVQILQG